MLKKRFSLSVKHLEESPWTLFLNQYNSGDIVKGVVRRMTDFGAFVELVPGVEGLVHVSQIVEERISHPKDALSVEQEVTVKIMNIDEHAQRVGLINS